MPLRKPLLGPIDRIIAKAEKNNHSKVKVKKEIVTYTRNWKALIYLLRSKPSHVRELTMNKEAAFRGLVDAVKWGVEGVWFSGTKRLQPFIWFQKWPPTVTKELCTDENPKGKIIICDLELLGILIHWLALEHAVSKAELKHQSPSIWCDNLAAVSWIYKFRSNTSTLAGNILRVLATRLHECEAGLLDVDHISGIYNIMADVVSQKHTTDLTMFLKLFTEKFKPPQGSCWSLYRQNTNLNKRIYSELLIQTSTMASWRRLEKKESGFLELGPDGLLSNSQQLNQTYKSYHSNIKLLYWLPTADMLDTGVFLTEKTRYERAQLQWNFKVSQQRSNWMLNKIPWQTRKKNIQRRFNSFWKDTKEKTHQHNQN